MANITLTRLTDADREQFILDNQYAFKYGAIGIGPVMLRPSRNNRK